MQVISRPEAIGIAVPADSVPSRVAISSGDIYVLQSCIGTALGVGMVIFHQMHHPVRTSEYSGWYFSPAFLLRYLQCHCPTIFVETKNSKPIPVDQPRLPASETSTSSDHVLETGRFIVSTF